jgi:hypothetical protein
MIDPIRRKMTIATMALLKLLRIPSIISAVE